MQTVLDVRDLDVANLGEKVAAREEQISIASV